MDWLKSQKLLVALDFFVELFKIFFAILILYGAILDKKFDVLGKIGIVFLGFVGFAVSQFAKYNMRDKINRVTSPTVLPIQYATIVPDKAGQIVKIKKLFVKDNILTVKFSVMDDKPFRILLQIIHPGGGELNGSKTISDIPIMPKWKDEDFHRQYANLDNLDLNEVELEKERKLVVKISYFSNFSVAEGLNDGSFKAFLQSGKMKEPTMHQYNRVIFKGSLRKKKFKIVG